MRIERTFTLGEHAIRIETGELARQATGAVLLDQAGTVVLATVVAAATPEPGQSFFPLTVDYAEKAYPAGRITNGRDRREGMASEREVLVSRLIATQAALGEAVRDLPEHAPGLLTMCVETDLIAEVIGSAGATVRAIGVATNASIDIADDGRITIRADSLAAASEAQRRIEAMVRNAVVIGRVYDATVVELIEFFGEIRPGRLGLLQESRMHVAEPLQLGETVRVQLVGRNRDGYFETTMLPASVTPFAGTASSAENTPAA